MHVNKVQSHG